MYSNRNTVLLVTYEVLYTLTKMEFVGSVIEDWVIPSFVEFMVRSSVFKPHKQSSAKCDSGMGWQSKEDGTLADKQAALTWNLCAWKGAVMGGLLNSKTSIHWMESI